jgi:archaellum biogenesis ATPase FlaH
MIYGPSNAGKTFAVLTYLLPLTLQGHGVIYVAGEDDKREIYRRASAWAQFNGSAAIEAMNAHFRVFPVMPLPQNQPVREFCATVQKDGFCPSVVVIDTLATAMAGLNENSAQDIQTFWGLCREIQTALDTSIFIVHHTGKDPTKDERGSSNIRAGADTTFRLSADKAAGIVAMDMRRQRNAAILKEPIIFRVRPMAGTLVYAPVDEKDRRQIVRSVGVVGEITAKFVKAISQLAAAGEPTPSLHLIAENIVPAGRRGDEPELRIGAVRAMEEKLRSYIRRQAKNGPWGPLLPYVVRDVLGAPEKPYRGRLPEDWEDADSDADLAP